MLQVAGDRLGVNAAAKPRRIHGRSPYVHTWLILACVSMPMLTPSAALPASLTLDTTQGLGADAEVKGMMTSDQSGQNFGDGETFAARWAPAYPRHEKGYIRFDLPDGEATFTNAALNIYWTRNFSKTYEVYGLLERGDYGSNVLAETSRLDELWPESDLTWDNAPGNVDDIADNGVNGDALYLYAFTTPASEQSVLSNDDAAETAALLSFIAADTDGLVTFIIRAVADSSGQGRFGTKENSDATIHAPILRLDYNPTPDHPVVGLVLPVSNVTGTAATVLVQVTSTGTSATAVSVFFGSTDGGTVASNWAHQTTPAAVSGPLPLFLNETLSSLTSNTVYHYRSHGANESGESWAPTGSRFITGRVELDASDAGGSEAGPDVARFTVSRPDTDTTWPLEVHYEVSGSAVSGQDYLALPGSVVIPAGAASADVVVTPVSDTDVLEPDEDVVMQLLPGGYLIGGPASAQVAITNNADAAPAFPGAEGAGRWAMGGRGGAVYIVTNLNDSGPGSLREAVEASGPRTVVFEVSGTIALASKLEIENPYITIAGQTAPGDGICLKDHKLVVNASDVVLRYLRFRPGDNLGLELDSLSVESGTNIIVDHCSASWSVDETLSVTPNADRVTVQWCLITEALRQSVHHSGNHAYGSLVQGNAGAQISFHHNLFAHQSSRCPRPGNVVPRSIDPIGPLVDFRNNVIYNWEGDAAGHNPDTNSVIRYNFVNNYYLPGFNTTGTRALRDDNPFAKAHFSGNAINGSVPADPWEFVAGDNSTNPDYRQSTPFTVEPVTTETAAAAYLSVMNKGGVYHARDSVDTRIINDVQAGTGQIIDDEADVGGWPALVSTAAPLDTDRDGMPDAWEDARGLDKNDPADSADDRLGDGFSNLEEYIHGIIEGPTRTITSIATGPGVIAPQGELTVAYGAQTTISIVPDPYWRVRELTLDGVPQTPTILYEFEAVTSDHQLHAEFGAEVTETHATPHWWLAQHGQTNFEEDASIDIDGDGQMAWEEYEAGTDPLDRQSVFRIVAQGSAQGSNWITWLGGNTSLPPFQVYATTNLGLGASGWVAAGSMSRSPDGTNTWHDTSTPSGVPVFYQIRVEN
ncbi:MAG: hypothetical protein O2923_06150 [Verrucomicrobia bacterium]|nr:hypothetical protein [Verrucomicrobiota bacterium]MDA1087521.1 hypothetical protein [Verrucomicrobiota bacterium]